MNLLVLAHDFAYGGIARMTFEIACGLARAGHTVTVAADRSRPCTEPARVPYRRRYLHRRSPRHPLLWLDILRDAVWARAHRLDGAIVPALFPGGVTALGLRTLLHVPYLVIAYGRELYVKNRRARTLAAAILNRASAIVAVSRFTAAEIARLYPRAAPTHAVYCGVDTERFRPISDREALKKRLGCGGRPVLLSVSRLVRHKGHAQVLRALPEIIRRVPSVLYVVVGEGPEDQAIRRHVVTHSLDDHVRLVGRVAESDLPLWYALCDVFVLPTRDTADTESGARAVEGFGIVFVEASACGRPVVGGRSGGTRDAVLDGSTGYLVDGNDRAAIRDGVLRLLADAALADRLGRQGRERVEREFTWERTVERFAAALATLKRR